MGELKKVQKGYVLIGDDQIIYEIAENGFDLEKLEDKKLILNKDICPFPMMLDISGLII